MKDLESPMKNKAKLFGIHLPVFIFLLITAVTLKTVGVIAFFKEGYFTNKVIGGASILTLGVGALFFLLYIIMARKDIKLIPSFSSPANYIPSALVGVAMLILTLHFLPKVNALLEYVSKLLSLRFQYSVEVDIPPTAIIQLLICIVIAISGILSVAYFVLNCVFIRTVSVRRARLGIAVIIFLAAYTAYIYFDNSFSMNSPIKVANEMAYLFSAVFFLFEVRLSLGREKWRHYIAFGFIASMLTAYSSIPVLIRYFIDGTLLSCSVEESVLTLTLFVFITAKLLLTGNLIEKKESPISLKLRELAEERNNVLNPASQPSIEPDEKEETEEFIPDENQISIEDLDNEDREDPEALSEEAAESTQQLSESEDTALTTNEKDGTNEEDPRN